MADILLKSASFICLIALGYFLKHKGIFGKTDFKILSKIVINITLPCAAIVSFSKYPPDASLLIIVALGFGMNWLMLLIASLASLITFREYTAHNPGKSGSYLLKFTLFNVGFVVALSAVALLVL